MANFTKKAIKASFLKLLDERPYSEITVRDIVEGCGINRNSFYYHFRDVPSLMEEIVREEAERIIADYPSIGSLEECIDVTIRFALDNRRAVLHLYHSVNRDIYERYLWTACEHTVRTYLDTVFPGRAEENGDREIIIRYYKCVCFGAISEWLSEGMKTDIRAAFHRLYELKHGQIEEMLRRSEAGRDIGKIFSQTP